MRPTTAVLHKPYGFISRFTPDGSAHGTLSAFGLPPQVHPIGRLDADSEGLLILSDDRRLQAQLLDPRYGHPRTYHVQVERIPDDEALQELARGIVLDGRITRPARVTRLTEDPDFAPRVPPIRHRLTVPTAWLAITLTEGRNRQVRRMTAAVGHPTLRLVRVAIGALLLGGLAAGRWRVLEEREVALLLQAH
ncbi:MAG TPA: pseudouridine synthase [Anaerolineae bacterium]|nr:pseudouridine synthase [Anaerolineae bacterium]